MRASHGISVDAAVTCGDLPELRSLTMPLIEELDLEVETLDSMEGLRPVGKAKLERLAERAPALDWHAPQRWRAPCDRAQMCRGLRGSRCNCGGRGAWLWRLQLFHSRSRVDSSAARNANGDEGAGKTGGEGNAEAGAAVVN